MGRRKKGAAAEAPRVKAVTADEPRVADRFDVLWCFACAPESPRAASLSVSLQNGSATLAVDGGPEWALHRHTPVLRVRSSAIPLDDGSRGTAGNGRERGDASDGESDDGVVLVTDDDAAAVEEPEPVGAAADALAGSALILPAGEGLLCFSLAAGGCGRRH